MKNRAQFFIITILSFLILTSCEQKKKLTEPDPAMLKKVETYASFALTSDLSSLTENEKKMLPWLFKAADMMEDIYWKEAYGDKEELMEDITDPAAIKYLEINYGPWDRLNGNGPFLDGFGEKPLGAQFYPEDMTKAEFEAFNDDTKTSLYSVVRRDDNKKLKTIPYHEYFKKEIAKAVKYLHKAAELADDAGLKHYLVLRAEALLSDDYFESDMAWMDMKTSPIDFIIGPIENYEDALYGYKAGHESFLLIKDQEWSNRLQRFAELLPALQRALPVDEAYKQEVPGSGSDLGVYDALYFAGDCNAGSKTIAINLPNDEKVQNQKGSRKLQLKNAMQAKFEKILIPIADELIASDQRAHINFDAFFENVMFHEVGHGLGVNNTINGQGAVRKVLSDNYSALEEAKADILGQFLVTQLTSMGEMGEKDLMDNYVTYLAGFFRSVRFGATNSHGVANMVQFNHFNEVGAFTRDEETGTYRVNFEQMQQAVNDLANMIIVIQGDGNYQAAGDLLREKGFISPDLQRDLDRLKAKSIPKDIVFEQGPDVAGLN